MNYGLDTSALLRLLTGEPDALARAVAAVVQDLLSTQSRLEVSSLVLSEAYFALQYHYQIPKEEALRILGAFFASAPIRPQGRALEILQQPALHKAKPGFVDRLIYADYSEAGLDLLTCERAAATLGHTRLITVS